MNIYLLNINAWLFCMTWTFYNENLLFFYLCQWFIEHLLLHSCEDTTKLCRSCFCVLNKSSVDIFIILSFYYNIAFFLFDCLCIDGVMACNHFLFMYDIQRFFYYLHNTCLYVDNACFMHCILTRACCV